MSLEMSLEQTEQQQQLASSQVEPPHVPVTFNTMSQTDQQQQHATSTTTARRSRRFTTSSTFRGTLTRSRATSYRAREILKKPRSKLWRLWQEFRLMKPKDMFFPVELTSIWRRHLVWSHKGASGSKEMLEIVTGRFASTQIFLALLFAAEIGTYFSPSKIVTDVRDSLRNGPTVDPLEYATGFMLIVSIILTGSAVLANYTAFGVFRCVGQENAATILRSEMGLYAATLPSRLTFFSILTFFAWNVLFWWINVNDAVNAGAIVLTIMTFILVGHVITTFSALGRLIMVTSAMGCTPILPQGDEENLFPHELSNVLLTEAEIAHALKTPVNLQYRNNLQPDKKNDDEPSLLTYEASLRRRYPDIVLEEVI